MHNLDGYFVIGYWIVRTIAASVAGGMLGVLDGAVLVIRACRCRPACRCG
jgi:hypothetical protein